MPPAVGLVTGGVGLLGSTAAGIIGSKKANRAARQARSAAQQSLDRALSEQPQFFQPSTRQQQDLLNSFQNFQTRPQFFTPDQEAAAADRLTSRFNRQTEQGRQRLNESTAARGLFRTGVAAGQEREFLNRQNEVLANQLGDQSLQFQQQRANELFRSNAQTLQARQQAAALQQALLGGQQQQFGQFLNFAQQQAAAAGQARQAANQATAQAIAGPFQALTQAGLLGAAGGFGGFGGAGGGAAAGASGFAPTFQPQPIGFNTVPQGFFVPQ